jgi:hypothetical protein
MIHGINSYMDTHNSSIYPSYILMQLHHISMKVTYLYKSLTLHIMNGLQGDQWNT